MITFDDALAFACTLDDVTIAPHYGTPAAKVRKKAFVMRGSEPGSFVLAATLDEIDVLRETDPATFWQSPHYEGWPAVLVREDAADRDRLESLIERAWAARRGTRPRRSG